MICLTFPTRTALDILIAGILVFAVVYLNVRTQGHAQTYLTIIINFTIDVCRLQEEWDHELASVRRDTDGNPVSKPSLKRALWRAFGRKMVPYQLAMVFEELAGIVSPVFLANLIQSLGNCGKETIICSNHTLYNASNVTNVTFTMDCTDTANVGSVWELWLYGLGLVSMQAILWILHHVAFWGLWRAGMHLRVASTVLIFNKSLSLDIQAMQKVSVGHVVNLASSDVEKFQYVGTMRACATQHTHSVLFQQ